MALILDTNALSAFADGDRRLLDTLSGEPDLAIPVVVLGEYLFGVQGSRSRNRYAEWLRANLPIFRFLGADRETASHYADIRGELKRAGTPIPSNDIWIAAIAREDGAALVSRDTHFASVPGLRVLGW